MPMPADDIIALIKAGIPDANVEMTDLAGDNDHWKAVVTAESFRGKSLPAVMRGVVETEGAAGLYKGLQAQLLKTVLAAAFSLTVKEKSFRTAMLVVLLMNRL